MVRSMALPVTEASQVGDARRRAATLAGNLSFGETEQGKLALLVTELGNNLVRHAKQGELLLRPLMAPDAAGIEVLALDRGPGMPSVDQCMQDGYSTGGTAGEGLGACRRLATVFGVYSQIGSGTAVLARVPAGPAARGAVEPTESGVVCLPYPGEEVCGDGWAVSEGPFSTTICVVDGLGHGLAAADASREALRVFAASPGLAPAALIQAAHGALRSTRGAAMAVARIDAKAGEIRYSGIGNISGSVFAGEQTYRMVSHNGTVGYQLPTVAEFVYPWPTRALLVMHSDGLRTQWRLDAHTGLARSHPSLVAGVLFRDHQRGRDDVTVLAVRRRPEKTSP
jgi:anti-sigma regulatory factor (Ser/Thr protein kinase)